MSATTAITIPTELYRALRTELTSGLGEITAGLTLAQAAAEEDPAQESAVAVLQDRAERIRSLIGRLDEEANR